MYRNKLILLFFLCFLYVSGYSQNQYSVFTLAGDTTNIYQGLDSNAGFHDGAASAALFNGPTGIAVDTAGKYVYVADTYNNVIRKINVGQGTVTTIAGDTADIAKGLDSNIGYVNGSPYTARFNNPWGVCVDDSGNVYVADTYNNVIRKIWATTGKVTTYAGKDSSGVTFAGYVNGADSAAEFNEPVSLAVDASGNVYVTDNGNNVVREISASAHMVTTLAGRGPDTSGYINGPLDTAEFYGLYGIALANSGAVLVAQFTNGYNAIRRIYHDTVTTYSGYDTLGFDTSATSYGPIPSGYRNGYQNVYQDGIDTNSVGDTSIVIIQGILYNDPTGIAMDTSGNLLIADEGNDVIRMFNARDSLVSTFAGNDSMGFRNGAITSAEFYDPMGVAADKKGNFYVADLGNNLIREITTRTSTGVTPVMKPINTLSVYPNPCINRLNIVSSFTGRADLLDVTGRIIWTDDNFKSPYSLATSNISPGIYFLRVTSSSATEIRKIEVLK